MQSRDSQREACGLQSNFIKIPIICRTFRVWKQTNKQQLCLIFQNKVMVVNKTVLAGDKMLASST